MQNSFHDPNNLLKSFNQKTYNNLMTQNGTFFHKRNASTAVSGSRVNRRDVINRFAETDSFNFREKAPT